MIFTRTTLLLAAAAGLAVAAPVIQVNAPAAGHDHVDKRQAPTDADILNYALTLEHLEDKFYREALANFTEADFATAGFDATVYANIQKVSSDETTHVKFLTGALQSVNVTPVAECTYAFGVTDVKSFLATASVLEGVGVSAYLGAAASIMTKAYLTDAGSILTVEARHSSYIRGALKEVPFAQPFDAPLTLDEVYSLASQFITSCPASNPPLPVKAFPVLQLAPGGPAATAGSTVTLLTPGYDLVAGAGVSEIYAAFIAVTGPTFVQATPVAGGFQVTIPAGFAGQTYVVITGCDDGVSDDTVAAGPAIIEISS